MIRVIRTNSNNKGFLNFVRVLDIDLNKRDGEEQPEAIRLYEKNDFRIIPNFGQYENIENSICFEKELKVI